MRDSDGPGPQTHASASGAPRCGLDGRGAPPPRRMTVILVSCCLYEPASRGSGNLELPGPVGVAGMRRVADAVPGQRLRQRALERGALDTQIAARLIVHL